MLEHFGYFRSLEPFQLKSFVTDVKERLLCEGEFLFKDQTAAHYLYFLLEGELRIEKEVFVSSKNYWPAEGGNWRELMVKNRVLHKVQEVGPQRIIGEREVIQGASWPVQAVGSG